MNTKYDKELDEILDRNLGIITSAQAQGAGISRVAFSDYVKRHGLGRSSRGIYFDRAALPDEMALLQMRFSKAVFSHDAALYLHDMTDREPVPLSVTVASNYNAGPLKDQGVRIYYVKPGWYDLGITEVRSPGGAMVKAYDKERTLCDIIRKRATTDSSVFRQAIREYARSKDKNLTRLSLYSQKMNMELRVREVMEVAL